MKNTTDYTPTQGTTITYTTKVIEKKNLWHYIKKIGIANFEIIRALFKWIDRKRSINGIVLLILLSACVCTGELMIMLSMKFGWMFAVIVLAAMIHK